MLLFSMITTNKPWSFDEHLMVLQCYNKDSNEEVMPFNSTHFWVQVHGIPIRFMNPHVATRLCETVGQYYVKQNHQLKTRVALWECMYLSTYHNFYVKAGWLLLRIIRNNGSPLNMIEFPTSATSVGVWHIMIEILPCRLIVKGTLEEVDKHSMWKKM